MQIVYGKKWALMEYQIHPSEQVSFLVRNPQKVILTLFDRKESAPTRWLLVCNGSYMIVHVAIKKFLSEKFTLGTLLSGTEWFILIDDLTGA